MKAVNLIIGILFLGISSVFSQTVKTDTIAVEGSCGMCKNRIEKTAKSVDGVTTADWNKATKKLIVSYDAKKTDIHKVHIAIAKIGYDTDIQKAEDKVYNALPGCCKYR